jgi:hypothetical protein
MWLAAAAFGALLCLVLMYHYHTYSTFVPKLQGLSCFVFVHWPPDVLVYVRWPPSIASGWQQPEAFKLS